MLHPEENTMPKTSWIALALALGLVLAGCPSSDDDDDDATADDDDATADDDDDATADDDDDDITDDDDDVADDDDDTSERIGLSGKSGMAVVLNGDYTGTEEMYFVAEDGDGEDVCRISYELNTVAERFDCESFAEACIWAYDLVVASPAVVNESDVGCEGVFGLDEAGVAALAGGEISRGYIRYLGHTWVLLEQQPDDTWAPFCNAVWDEATGEVEYNWIDASLPY
jgi:hypothetical protein